MGEDTEGKGMGPVIQIDEARIRAHLGEMLRGTVKETLNAMLDAEADRLWTRSADANLDSTLHLGLNTSCPRHVRLDQIRPYKALLNQLTPI
jgi:hypothetical protein